MIGTAGRAVEKGASAQRTLVEGTMEGAGQSIGVVMSL